MGEMHKITLYLSLALLLTQAATSNAQISREEYIQRYQKLAKSQMENYGVPASIIMAQGILESGSGNSTLAVKANNHFGIKCHKNWTGPRIYHDDDAKGECFRKYRSPEKSFQDHSEFLRGARRYAFLFDLDPTDYKGWANGLRKAGYATDPQYPQKLIRIIEEHKLFQLDRGVEIKLESPTKGMGELVDPDNFTIDIFKQRKIYTRNRIKYIIVEEGDSYQSLTKDLDLMPWQIANYNEIARNAKLEVGQEVYIQPKRRRAEPNHPFHIVEEGETLYDISQIYGIKLKSLYYRNRTSGDNEPEVGAKIYLRGRRPRVN
jgi:LysM repeat protein